MFNRWLSKNRQPMHRLRIVCIRSLNAKIRSFCDCNKVMWLASNYAICLFVKLKFICTFANIDDRFVYVGTDSKRKNNTRNKEKNANAFA